MGYIYLATNNINGKQYVGQTKYDIKTRWIQHKCEAKRLIPNVYFVRALLVILSNHKSSYQYVTLHTTSSDLQIKILHPHTQPYILFHVLMADGEFFAVKCLRNSRM